MKKLSLLLVVFAFAFGNLFAQTAIVDDYMNEYQPFTLYTGVDVAAADTSDIMQVPADVGQGFFYFVADTVTASDTLKTIKLQVSPDAENWCDSGISITNITAAGTTRYAVTQTDKYYRLIFAVAGSSIKIDFTCLFIPKQYRPVN